MTDTYILLVIAVSALVTAAIRFLPFLIFNGSRSTPPIIDKLGKTLPYAIMAMLVVYCLKGVSFASLAGFVPSLLACAIVVLLHVLKRNTLVSIVGGTVIYMLLVQLVF